MGLIIENKIFDLIFTVIILAIVIYYLQKAKKKEMPDIRKLPALDALDEAIGRSVELGRPVCWSNMQTKLTDEMTPEVIAGLSVLNYVAGETAKKGVRLIASFEHADVYPIVESTMREAYTLEGIPELYNESTDVLFMPEASYAIGMLELAYKEKPGCLIMIGRTHYPTVLVSEVFSDVGAFQVLGTGYQWSSIPYMISAADYVLIGEEVFVAGGYLAKDVELLNGILAEEWVKWICILILLGGSILINVGFDVLSFLEM